MFTCSEGPKQTSNQHLICALFAVVIVNSNFKHALAGLDSEYNQRRAQCESAARHFGVTALRDVSREELNKAEQVCPLVSSPPSPFTHALIAAL